MSSPRVSVVLPTYNRAGLLRRSIDSVLAQTYRDLELIVVDDCSTDATAQVIASIDDPRLVYVRRQQNGRAALARNDGIGRARGEFIAFQDDDDVWLPHKLARQVEALDSAPAEVGLCLCGHVRYSPGYAAYIGGPRFFELLDFRQGQTLWPDYSLIATPAWLVRKAALLQAGLFDPRMRSWDDLELAMRLERVCRFTHVNEPLYLQDHVAGSGMMKQFHNFAHDLQVILERHADRWSHDRLVMAKHYFIIGRLELNYGSPAIARQWFARALRERPLSPFVLCNWLGTWTPQRIFRGLSRLARRVLHRRAWWLGDRGPWRPVWV